MLAGAAGESGAPARERTADHSKKANAKRGFLGIGDASDIAALDRCYPCSESEKRRHVEKSMPRAKDGYKEVAPRPESDGNMGGPKDVGSSNLQRDPMGALGCNESGALHAELALQVRTMLAWCLQIHSHNFGLCQIIGELHGLKRRKAKKGSKRFSWTIDEDAALLSTAPSPAQLIKINLLVCWHHFTQSRSGLNILNKTLSMLVNFSMKLAQGQVDQRHRNQWNSTKAWQTCHAIALRNERDMKI